MTMAAPAPASHPLRGVRAAIIDLDGTMLHTMPDFHVAINRMLAELSPSGWHGVRSGIAP